MKPDVLVLFSLRPDQQKELEAGFTLHRYDLAEDKAAFVDEVGEKIVAAVASGGKGLVREQIEKMPNLKIIASNGVGYDATDVVACSERGIKVTNTPDVLNDDVADMALGLFLAVRRELVKGDAHVRSGAWGPRWSDAPHTQRSRQESGYCRLGPDRQSHRSPPGADGRGAGLPWSPRTGRGGLSV